MRRTDKDREAPPRPPKVHVNLWAEEWLVVLSKTRGVNMSQALEEALRTRLGVSEDPSERISKLELELDVLKRTVVSNTAEAKLREDFKRAWQAHRIWSRDMAEGYLTSAAVQQDYPFLKGMSLEDVEREFGSVGNRKVE